MEELALELRGDSCLSDTDKELKCYLLKQKNLKKADSQLCVEKSSEESE